VDRYTVAALQKHVRKTLKAPDSRSWLKPKFYYADFATESQTLA